MSRKQYKTFQDSYNLMMSQKIAFGMSPATISRVKVIWKKSLAPFWATKKPSEVNPELIVDFINWHKENRPGVQFVNVFKYLGNILNVMVETGMLDVSKKPKLELTKGEQKHHAKQKGRYITDEEFERILRRCSGWFKLYFAILFTSGFRKMELGKLTVDRLRKVDKRYIATLTTDDTKTGRAREVPFSEMLTPLVDDQLKEGSPFLFPAHDKTRHVSPQRIDAEWVRAKRAAKIEGKCRLHDLRHSCASNLAKDAINPIVVVTQLGMSLQMFQKTYLKLKAEDLYIASDSSNKRIKNL